MRGLDTNVLVRFLLNDDRAQSAAARTAIEVALRARDPLMVSLLVMLETEWVLRANAGFTKLEIVGVFKKLLESRDLLFEAEAVLERALYAFESGRAEFADCLMIAQYREAGCTSMLTFDAKAGRLEGAELLGA